MCCLLWLLKIVASSAHRGKMLEGMLLASDLIYGLLTISCQFHTAQPVKRE